MKRLLAVIFCLLISALIASGQQPSPSADPYKATLDHLQSLVTQELPDWNFHADLPHPEDANLNATDWPTVHLHDKWETGPRVLRRWIEIPQKLNGYSTQGARVDLNLVIRSNDSIVMT